MSRCFPFPPPGYEKKPRSDGVDSLAKQKDRKRKHKREKKDKEKRDGKERNDKHKDKQKEKKDQKAKHKERRRHNDEDKEKIYDRPIEEGSQDQNAKEVCNSNNCIGEVKNFKFREELAKSYKDDGATNRKFENGNSSVHTSEGSGLWSSMEKRKHNKMEVVNNTSKQSRSDGPCITRGNKKAKEISPLAINITNRDNRNYDETAKLMEKELDERNAQHRALGKQDMDTSNSHKDKRKNNVLGQLVQKGTEKTQWKEANDKQNVTQSTVKCQLNNDKLHQTSVDAAKYIEENEKSKVREVDGAMPNHHRHKDQEEKKQRKDKERYERKMRTEEKNNCKHERKEHKSNDIQEKHRLVTQRVAAIKDNEKYADVEENLKKRKDQPMNGILYEIDLWPNKIPRPIENGRKMESYYLPTPSDKLGAMNSDIDENHALGKSKHAINGALSVGSIPADMSQNGGASLKAPHPDSKYLKAVYSVPKMEDRLEFENQDWLFHQDVSQLKRKSDVETDDKIPQVWSKGRKIESADVFALPYVIPF